LNGNQISTGYAYDAENRLVQTNAGAAQIGYDAQNKAIWWASFTYQNFSTWVINGESVSMYGIDGKLIGSYSPQPNWTSSQTPSTIPFYSGGQRVYFGKKLVATLDTSGYQIPVVQDRLESVGKYYPFGEQRTTPPPGAYASFATYGRNSATGLDYADQRYYASTFGRFMTADQYQATPTSPSDPNMPASWNRYAYVINDPVNLFDPHGTTYCFVNQNTGMVEECYDSVDVTASISGIGGSDGGGHGGDNEGMLIVNTLVPTFSGGAPNPPQYLVGPPPKQPGTYTDYARCFLLGMLDFYSDHPEVGTLPLGGIFIGLRGIQWGPGFAVVSALVLTVDQILIEDRIARDCARDQNYTPWFLQP
jgi:RHS repeat-associated protein